MSAPYANKSDADIIAEQAASLARKEDRFDASTNYDPKRTTLGDESGVNESGIQNEFPGATVEVGRTGRTGGGDNMVRFLFLFSPFAMMLLFRREDTGSKISGNRS